MKVSHKARANKTGSRFVLRPYRRIPTWYLSYYMSGDLVGKGVITNLSCTGMRVLGDHAMKPGTALTVQLTLEEDKPPLEIKRVSVQWVKEAEFGLQIVSISPVAAKRIAHLLAFQARAHRGEL